MSSEMRLPKNRVPVRISIGGEIVTAEMFLAEYAPTHVGPERVIDVLNGSDAFIPVVAADDRLRVLARSAIRWVGVAAAAIGSEADVPGEPIEIGVEVTFDDSSTVAGAVRYVAPPGRARLPDFLNDSPMFIPVIDEDSVYLVNRGRIATVTIRD